MATRNFKAIDASAPAANTVSAKIDTLGSPYLTMYVKGGAGVSSGAVQLESSPTGSLSAEPSQLDWVAVGSPVTVTASTTLKATSTEASRFVRARVSTAVVGGQATVYITTAAPTDGANWEN